MALTPTIVDQHTDGKRLWVIFNVTLTGNYATGGVVLDFASAGVPSEQPPIWMEFQNLLGYSFTPVYGTDIGTTNKVQGWSAAGTELTAAAFPGSLPNAVLGGLAMFQQNW